WPHDGFLVKRVLTVHHQPEAPARLSFSSLALRAGNRLILPEAGFADPVLLVDVCDDSANSDAFPEKSPSRLNSMQVVGRLSLTGILESSLSERSPWASSR